MNRPNRIIALGFLLAATIPWQQAWGISMPAGSTVWMKFEASAGPDADGDDVAGSNQAGPAPPNGIPFTTISDGTATATGYAEILPGSVRTFISSNFSASMHASFEDTYTIGGSAVGPFDIDVQLRITGTIRSQPAGPFHQLIGSAQAEIGTFSPVTELGGVPLNEGFRVTPFDPSGPSTATASFPFESQGAPFSHPIDVTATYTVQDVSVGGTFVLAFGVNTGFSKGEIDLLNTGTILFDLPAGVTLTSALGLVVPEPSGLALLAAGALSVAGFWLRRRRPLSNPGTRG